MSHSHPKAIRILIIGYGSIGRRHAAILQNLGCQVHLVTEQTISEYPTHKSLTQALAEFIFDYIVIANPTHLHHHALMTLVQEEYSGVVLVEKPLFANVAKLPIHKIKKIIVGYNLRFHAVLVEAKKLLANEKILTFTAYVGQYLPTWRKLRDYRQGYSTQNIYGGGVLRELSHELDYALWFCGKCQSLTAQGGHISHLEMTADDAFSILMKTENCPLVNLHLNCLDRMPQRKVIINTDTSTIEVDLLQGQLKINGNLHFHQPDAAEKSYLNQHEALLQNNFESFCSFEAGLEIMQLIEAIEIANTTHQWINL